MTISNGDVRIDCTSWADLVAQLASNEKLKSIFWINIDVWNDFNIASEDGKLTDWIIGSDAFSGPCSTLVLRINGHKISGNSIVVSKPNLTFQIEDNTYRPVTVSTTSPYSITNANKGLVSLNGFIDAKKGATVHLVSGCVDSKGHCNGNRGCTFRAIGGQDGYEYSTVIITGGYVTGVEGCVSAQYKGATVNIDGNLEGKSSTWDVYGDPVLQATDNAAVMGNGTKGLGGTTITLGRSTIIGNITTPGYAAMGVYHPQDGTLSIGDGAFIVGYSPSVTAAGVVMRAGQLNMTGGTIIADGLANTTGQVGDNKPLVPSSGIVFDPDANYPDRATLKTTVSGGTISGKHSAVELINDKGYYEQGQITLTGGTYNSDVAEFAGEGLGLVINSITEKYTFAEGREAVTVDADGVERYYNKLSDALYYAGVEKTTKMLQDVNVVDGTNSYIGIVADGITTLDLNGHKLSTASEKKGAIELCNQAQLVIEDSQSGGVVETTSANVAPVLFSPGVSDKSCVLTIKGGTFKSRKYI